MDGGNFVTAHRRDFILFKETQSYRWRADSINLWNEASHFLSISREQLDFVKFCSAAAVLDCMVFDEISYDLLQELDDDIDRACFIGSQIYAEHNHREFYHRLLENCVKTDSEKKEVFELAANTQSFDNKKNWVDLNNDSLARKVAKHVCVKLIFRITKTVAALYFRREGMTKGFSVVGDEIQRELIVHMEFLSNVYQSLAAKLEEHEAKEIIGEAVEIERQFHQDSKFCETFNIEPSAMDSYIQFSSGLAYLVLECTEFPTTAVPGVLGWLNKVQVSRRVSP